MSRFILTNGTSLGTFLYARFITSSDFDIQYFPLCLVPRWRIELPYPPCKDGVLPLNYRGLLSVCIILCFF